MAFKRGETNLVLIWMCESAVATGNFTSRNNISSSHTRYIALRHLQVLHPVSTPRLEHSYYIACEEECPLAAAASRLSMFDIKYPLLAITSHREALRTHPKESRECWVRQALAGPFVGGL